MWKNDATNFAYFHTSLVPDTRAAAECKGDKLKLKVAFYGNTGTHKITLGVESQDMQTPPTCQQRNTFRDIEGDGASENGTPRLSCGAATRFPHLPLGSNRSAAGLPDPEHRHHFGQEPRQHGL
ncbi:hypothetical protein scyTo_0002573 [Scyliorhinus torazame]|uniref:Uncharacterized protein n=1 Tax=Scyliorhinus torazame TaxID=75743 RepID=A0A401PK40_SCYTO|nr:hypothetical protein [Scyliorhinus torazame]